MSDQLSSFTGADGEADDVADCVGIMGRLADEFRPDTDEEDDSPVFGEAGYTGESMGYAQ